MQLWIASAVAAAVRPSRWPHTLGAAEGQAAAPRTQAAPAAAARRAALSAASLGSSSAAAEPEADADGEVEILMQQQPGLGQAAPCKSSRSSSTGPKQAASAAAAEATNAAGSTVAPGTSTSAASPMASVPALPACLGPALFDQLMCAIAQELMIDPVLAADGNTYERTAIAGRRLLDAAAGLHV